MRTLKVIKGISVNLGDGMARGLYNLSREDELTYWFDEETLDNLMDLSDGDFENEFEKMI